MFAIPEIQGYRQVRDPLARAQTVRTPGARIFHRCWPKTTCVGLLRQRNSIDLRPTDSVLAPITTIQTGA